jgi:hypothetical protein
MIHALGNADFQGHFSSKKFHLIFLFLQSIRFQCVVVRIPFPSIQLKTPNAFLNFDSNSINMLTKTMVLKSIKNLPDKFSFDDLLDRIVLLQKIEIGLEQSNAGQTKSTVKAKEKLKKWLK